ncbi:MAG: radical SAM protein [Methanoregula sp.]
MKCLIILIRYTRPSNTFNPNTKQKNFDYYIPVGLGYISAFLKQNNHEIHFLNLNHIDGIVEELIRDKVSQEKFDFIITGGISPFYPDIKNCLESIRKYDQNTRIIVGGGLISSQPEIMFELLQPDFGIIGEGELTINELFECLANNGDTTRVNGLIFRKSDGQIIKTKPRDPINNLDILPWPDYEGMGFSEFLDHMVPSLNYFFISVLDNPRVYPIIASRSCPFSCTFCFHPLGKKYRKRSLQNIMGELEYVIKKYKINIICFYDELFSNDKVWVYEFCKRFSDFLKTVPWEVKWNCQMRVDDLDEEMIIAMKNAGCYCLSLGLESYSTTVLKSMKKNISPNQINLALRLCANHNMGVQGNFIFGDTAETVETYRETIKYWEENDKIIKNSVGLFPITLYQGSPIYKLALEKGIINDEIAFIEERVEKGLFPVNFTDRMTDDEFKKMHQDIYNAMITPKRFSEPLLIKKINGAQEIHITCPFCGGLSIYRDLPVTYSWLVCRKCNARIVLITKKEKISLYIQRFFGFKAGNIIIRYILSPPYQTIKKLFYKNN